MALAPRTSLDVDLVVNAMEDLNEKQREILILSIVRKLSGAEIAEILGIGVTTVRWRLHDARANLWRKIEILQKAPPATIDVSELITQTKELSPYLISHLRQRPDDLRNLDSGVFEHLIAEFFASWGYRNVSVVGDDAWTSADVVAMERNDKSGVTVKYFVEVKRWKNRVGVEVVNQILGAMTAEKHRYGWHIGMIVGLTGFKKMKRDEPGKLGLLGVELRGGEQVHKWLRNYHPSAGGLWLPKARNTRARLIYGGGGANGAMA